MLVKGPPPSDWKGFLLADQARIDWLEKHKDANLKPCNTHVKRQASRVELWWMPEYGALQRITANSVREAIDAAIDSEKA